MEREKNREEYVNECMEKLLTIFKWRENEKELITQLLRNVYVTGELSALDSIINQK